MSAGGAQLRAAELAEAWRPAVNPWIVTMTVMLATFMEVLDGTIANVALPHIASNLSASVDEATWVLTSYLVSNAIVLPLSGWFSSLFGRKQFYMVSVAIFTLGSLACGLAPSLGWLVFFRVLQGAGGGALQPVSQAILVESFSLRKQGMAMDILRQPPGRHPVADPDERPRPGPAVSRPEEPQDPPHRLHRPGPPGGWPGVPPGRPRQGPARRLVLVELHPHVRRHLRRVPRGRRGLGTSGQGSDRGSAAAEGPELPVH